MLSVKFNWLEVKGKGPGETGQLRLFCEADGRFAPVWAFGDETVRRGMLVLERSQRSGMGFTFSSCHFQRLQFGSF